jgi:periplasmic protein CpxP/Spy
MPQIDVYMLKPSNMKRLTTYRKCSVYMTLIAFLLAALMSLPLAAQQGMNGGGHGGATPEERAKRQTEIMQEKLSLTASQEPKVMALNLKYAKKMEEVRKITDTAVLHKTVRNLSKQKDGELKTVLTADQFKSYLKQIEEMKARRHEMKH